VEEQRLPGGNAGGAVLAGGTVRRATGPWTPAIHALLRHLESRGFDGAPRALGFDEQGREVLSFLPGATIGLARPWPRWVHSDDALVQVGAWLRRYHDVVADFLPPAGTRWRMSSAPWRPGEVVGHNDAAPYNAVWAPAAIGAGALGAGGLGHGVASAASLVGFIDWDFAGPCPPVRDLAFVAFSWVPLHARDIVLAEGFTRFADRPQRLRLLLDAYGYTGTVDELLAAVSVRISDHIEGLRALATAGDPVFTRLVADGAIDGLDRALSQLREDASDFGITAG